VQSHHHQGAHYLCLLKLQLLKQPIKIKKKLFLHVRPFRENLFLHLQSTTSMLLVFYFATLSFTNDKPIIFIMVRQGVLRPTRCSGFEITLRHDTLGKTPLDG